MTNRKKIIIIASVAAGLIIFGLILAYFLYFRGIPAEERGTIGKLFPTAEEKEQPAAESAAGKGQEEKEIKRKLVQLTTVAISGLKAMSNGRVRYLEKAAGHLYEIGGGGEERVRVSNTTIPKIFDVLWSADADKAILSIFEDGNVRYFSAAFTGTSTSGVFLPANINLGGYAPQKDRILYSAAVNERHSLIIANPDNAKQTKIHSTPFGDFLISWPEENTISLLTRPAGAIEGYLYKINLQTGIFSKVIGGLRGLEALWSPDGKKILISRTSADNREVFSQIISLQGITINLGPKTLADKCVWSAATSTANVIYCGVPVSFPAGVYPDDWFKGKVSFDDYLVKINTAFPEATEILTERTFDIEKIAVDPANRYLYFLDKKDETLWGLRLD
ncbi:MAG: hypothetical protein AAB564_00525 [Patescibacteria group bacterium]